MFYSSGQYRAAKFAAALPAVDKRVLLLNGFAMIVVDLRAALIDAERELRGLYESLPARDPLPIGTSASGFLAVWDRINEHSKAARKLIGETVADRDIMALQQIVFGALAEFERIIGPHFKYLDEMASATDEKSMIIPAVRAEMIFKLHPDTLSLIAVQRLKLEAVTENLSITFSQAQEQRERIVREI